jgi:hypothetical protein
MKKETAQWHIPAVLELERLRPEDHLRLGV